MFQGLRTVVYQVRDLTKAKDWYANVLGIQPYFDQPFYVGFNVGGYELGLVPTPDAGAKRLPGNRDSLTGASQMPTALTSGCLISERRRRSRCRMLGKELWLEQSTIPSAMCSASSRIRTSRSQAN